MNIGSATKTRARLRVFRALLIAAFVCAVPVALVTTTIRIAVSDTAVYDYAVQHYGSQQASGIPEQDLLKANDQIHDYLTNNRSGALSIQVRNQNGEAVPLFNAREVAHMADVRDLVHLFFIVQVAALAALLLFGVLIFVLWKLRTLALAALYGSVLTAALITFTGIFAVTGFDSAWSQFHGIAFSNDFWELNPARDHLIQMFPESFWFDITILIGACTLLESLLISAVSGAYMLSTREKAAAAGLGTPGAQPRQPGVDPPGSLASSNPER